MPEEDPKIDMVDQPPVVRLGHHAIELGKAAEEIGIPSLTKAVQAAMVEVGITIARLAE